MNKFNKKGERHGYWEYQFGPLCKGYFENGKKVGLWEYYNDKQIRLSEYYLEGVLCIKYYFI